MDRCVDQSDREDYILRHAHAFSKPSRRPSIMWRCDWFFKRNGVELYLWLANLLRAAVKQIARQIGVYPSWSTSWLKDATRFGGEYSQNAIFQTDWALPDDDLWLVWLTASEKRGCLLFAKDRFSVWTHTGFANLTCLTKAALIDTKARPDICKRRCF